MTYFSFQVLNDIIYNYHKPPRIENSLKTIIFLRGRTKKKKKKTPPAAISENKLSDTEIFTSPQ